MRLIGTFFVLVVAHGKIPPSCFQSVATNPYTLGTLILGGNLWQHTDSCADSGSYHVETEAFARVLR